MSDNFTEQDDTVSTSSKYDFSQGCMDIVPAPAPPRQTMSYASAMKHKRPSQDDSEAQRRSTSLPLSIQIDGHDSGVELKSGSTTDSECSELFSNKDTMSPVKDRTVRMPSVPSLPLASAEVELLSSRSVDCESSSSSTEGLEKSSSINGAEARLPKWDLFDGTSFELGERIIANLFLPIWSVTKKSEVPIRL